MTRCHRWVLSTLLVYLLPAVAALSPRSAHAEGTAPAAADSSTKAREAFQKANVHYALGEFAQAAELYQEAYKLKPDAALLYNAAQSFRLAGNAQRALVLYKNYLLFYPQQKNVAEVKQQIVNLQTAIATSEKAQSAPPTGTVQPRDPATGNTGSTTTPPVVASSTPPSTTTPPTTTTEPAPTPATVTPPTTTTTPTATPTPAPTAERKPVYKKWWFWVATIGGAAVVAGAVTAGVLVSRRNADNGPDWATTAPFGSGARTLNVSQVGVSW